MRRWHAIPVAALVALTVGAALLGSVGTTTTVQAGTTTAFEVALDCDVSTAGIQDDTVGCNEPAGTTTLAVDVILLNNSGSAATLGNFNFEVVADQLFSNPVTGSDGNLNANPDFQISPAGGWACNPPSPDEDTDADGSVAKSFLSCFDSAPATSIANGATLVLARVTYTTIDGVGNFSLEDVLVADEFGSELISCNPLVNTAGNCFTAQAQIGTAGAPSTSTPTNTPTNTPVPTNTCVGAACPTSTPLRYITVTFTPSATVPATATPAAPGEQPPPPPAGGTPGTGVGPGGGPGGTGSRPITLPDTGAGSQEQVDWRMASLIALAALGAGGLAGGATLALNGRKARR